MAAVLGAVVLPAVSQEIRVAYKPFTARIREQYWTESGRCPERHATFARRADGSFCFISDEAAPNDPAQKPVVFFSYRLNVPRRQYISAEPFTKTACGYYIPDDRELQRMRDSYGACEHLHDGQWRLLGRSRVLGYKVYQAVTLLDCHFRPTEWVAPDLQCFALKSTDFVDGFPRERDEVSSLDFKEPDPSLFEPPAGYELLSPLEQEKRYQAMFTGAVFVGTPGINNLERQYQAGLAAMKRLQQK